MLVDAQVSDRFQVAAGDRVRLLGERGVHRRPRDAVVPGGFRRSDAPFGDLVPAVLQQPPGDAAARRDLRCPLGERDPRAGPVPARQPALFQDQVHFPASVPDIPRPGRHVLVHALGNRPAPGAGSRTGNLRPDRQPPAGVFFRPGHRHAFHPQQHRRRILGRRGLVVLGRHKSGSSGPRFSFPGSDTRHSVTPRSQPAERRSPGQRGLYGQVNHARLANPYRPRSSSKSPLWDRVRRRVCECPV